MPQTNRRALTFGLVACATALAAFGPAGDLSATRASFAADQQVSGVAFTAAALEAPSGLTVTPVTGGLQLTWSPTPSTYADGYKVYRAASDGGPWAEVATVAGRDTTTWTDSSAPAGTSYYQVRSYRVNWISGTTNVSDGSNIATPGQPTDLSASRVQHTTNSLALQFRVPANGGSAITSYRIVRNDGVETTASPSTWDATGGMKTVGVPVPDFGATWTYKILAVNATGDGPWSELVSWVRPAPVTPTMSSMTASWSTYDYAVVVQPGFYALTDGDSAVTGYEARTTDGANTFSSATSPVKIPASQGPSGIVDGRSHTFELRALNAVGPGPWAGPATVYVPVQWWPRRDMIGVRTLHAMARDNSGNVYAIGGRRYSFMVEDTLLSSVERYNPATDTWTTVASLPSGRDRHTAATGADGRIYVIGGMQTPRSVAVFDGSTWSTLAYSTATNRVRAGSATDAQGRIYVVGGSTDGADATALATVERYDPANPTAGWQPVAAMSTPRHRPGVAADAQGRIYAIGGTAADGTAVASAERFDPATGIWSAIPSPGSNFTAAATDHLGRIYAVCEGAIMVPAALRRFDPALGTWETLGAGSFRGSQAVAADTAGRLYASGGTVFMGDSERVFSQYDPSRGPR